MDDIDRAQEREQLDRTLALDAMRARIDAAFAPRDPSVDDDCIDCGEPIEPERIRVLRVTSRCAACAHEHERRFGRG